MAEELRWEEGMLEDLARAVTFPATPELRPSVMARIGGEESPARLSRGPWRLAVAAVAVAVFAAALVVTLSTDARDAVAEFFGLGVRGEQIEVLPTPGAGTTATPFPTAPQGGARFEAFAREVTRPQVAALGIPMRLPGSLGEPDRLWHIDGGPDIVIADYGDIQVWQMVYEGDYFIGKGIAGGGDVVQEVRVNGHPGYWVRGGERIVSIREADGRVVTGTQRTVTASALLWSAGNLYTRIEGAGSLEAAFNLAGEIR